MATPSSDLSLETHLSQIRPRLNHLDSERLARQSGFLKRAPRKIKIPDWLAGLIALGADSRLSLERIAATIALAAATPYSKQALSKRVTAAIEFFLALVATSLLGQAFSSVKKRGFLRPFNRVLLHDSTTASLPAALASAFPGSRNQRKKKPATLKIQFIVDLLGSAVVHWSLSGFTRNDQAAAPDILQVAQPKDLIIRDLGYFVLKVFRELSDRGVYFLSRCRHGLLMWDAQTGKKLDLVKLLKANSCLDRQVLVGEEKVPLRVVARPVPAAVANERRRKARLNRDRRLKPSEERLFLMGWNIFVTNVPLALWPPEALYCVYRVRWRVETIFKAWKSHLKLLELNTCNPRMVRLSALTKLLYCMIVVRYCDTLESLCGAVEHVSLLRLARIMSQCACLFAAAILQLTPQEWVDHQLRKHVFYEKRTDRINFYQLLQSVQDGLG